MILIKTLKLFGLKTHMSINKLKQEYRDEIARQFLDCVQRTVERVTGEDGTNRPFHSALLSEEALFWSRFERSFSTSFGQTVIERISAIAALSNGASFAGTQTETAVFLYQSTLQSIDNHISNLRGKNHRGSWNNDLYEINSVPYGGLVIEGRIISDLSWVKDGVVNYMSIKTVKPNIDQTAESKRDLLKLKVANPDSNVYFGLYYNPYGEPQSTYKWAPPQKIFNFLTDPCVLIGRNYWDTLGGVGFYDEILSIVESVGHETRGLISF